MVVVLVIALPRPVGVATVEKLVPANEINRQPLAGGKTADFSAHEDIAQLDFRTQQGLRLRRVGMLDDAAVAGHEDRHFVAAIHQCARQRGDRVRQAAGFHIRKQFARRLNDFHGIAA